MSEHVLNWLSKLICLNMPLEMSMGKEKEQIQNNQQGTYGLCQSANTIKGIQLSDLKRPEGLKGFASSAGRSGLHLPARPRSFIGKRLMRIIRMRKATLTH